MVDNIVFCKQKTIPKICNFCQEFLLLGIRYFAFSCFSFFVVMELSVRAYIFDEDERVLMVRHSADQPWVLPGGHVEEGEHFYNALIRELDEEL